MKNAGTVVPKILANFSIAALCYWAVGFALAFGGAGWFAGTEGTFLGTTDPGAFPATGVLAGGGSSQVLLPVRVLRGVAGDRVGHHDRAHQVRRLPDLRGRLQRADLPDHQPLDLRWRLAPGELRHAGLRRFDGGPPDRRHGRAGGAAAARPAPGQVRRRRQAERDPRTQHAARGAGGPGAVVRLVRVQRGLDARRDRRPLRRRGGGHAAGRRRRRPGRAAHQLPDNAQVRHGHDRQRRDRRAGGDHRPLGLCGVLGRPADRLRGRRDRGRRDHRDRQEARRPGRRALGARHCRNLGNARLRAVHEPAAGGAERDRRRRSLLHRLGPPARRAGARHSRGVRLSVHGELPHLLRDQEDLRAAREAGGGALRPRHRRARHVGLPGGSSCPSRGRSTVPRRCRRAGHPASRRRSPWQRPESRRARAR